MLNQTYPVKFREKVGAQFTARNIDFIFNDVVESFPDSDSGHVDLKSGRKIQADFIVSGLLWESPNFFQLLLSIRYEHRDRDRTRNSLRHLLVQTF